MMLGVTNEIGRAPNAVQGIDVLHTCQANGAESGTDIDFAMESTSTPTWKARNLSEDYRSAKISNRRRFDLIVKALRHAAHFDYRRGITPMSLSMATEYR